MRAVLSAISFFLIIIVITLIYKLPAKFVYQKLPPHHAVQLNGISGSIWSGRIGAVRTQQLTIRNIDWTLSAWRLLLGEADIQWQIQDPAMNLQGELMLSRPNIHLTNVSGSIDLLALAERLPAQDFLLAGRLDVDISEIGYKNTGWHNASGQVVWKSARVLSPTDIELGGFKADLSSKAGRLVAQLNDIGGAVQLSGNSSMSRQGSYDYVVEIGIRDTSVPRLLEAFNYLEKHNENGLAKLRGNGRLF